MVKNKKILICGASGFIGQNATNFFSKDNKVFGTYFKNKPKKKLTNVKWIYVNLLDRKSINYIFKNYKFDIVIQCAAVTAGVKSMNKDPFLFISDNAIMNSLLVKFSAEYKVNHFIFMSCTVMYSSSNRKLTENDFDYSKKIHPSYEGIAYTKLYIENICKFYSNNSDTKFTCLRHSNIYGPYDKFDNPSGHFMSSVISRIFKNKNKILEIWGDGSEKRDFLYVDDLINAIFLIIKKQKNKFKLYNLSYGKSFSIKEIVKLIIQVSKLNKQPKYLKNKPTIKVNILVDNNKIKKELEWNNKINLKEGINKTINWYKSKKYKIS